MREGGLLDSVADSKEGGPLESVANSKGGDQENHMREGISGMSYRWREIRQLIKGEGN